MALCSCSILARVMASRSFSNSCACFSSSCSNSLT
uniref:Uncharacterized protein n=1 Tax=Rhizophora mucronata TaxID=61149 RepID=A0A2P2Q5N6_RHIMU